MNRTDHTQHNQYQYNCPEFNMWFDPIHGANINIYFNYSTIDSDMFPPKNLTQIWSWIIGDFTRQIVICLYANSKFKHCVVHPIPLPGHPQGMPQPSNTEFKIQNSKFKIKYCVVHPSHCTGIRKECPYHPIQNSKFKIQNSNIAWFIQSHCLGIRKGCPNHPIQNSKFKI